MDNEVENTNTLVLPLLVTRGLVVFPNMTESIEAGRPYSVKAIDVARRDSNSLLFVGVQRQLQKDEVTGEEDVYMTATLCRVVNFLSANGVYRIRVIGSKRVALTNLRFDDGTWKAEGKVIPDLLGDQNEETALIRRIVKAVEQTPAIAHDIPKSALNALGRGETPNNIGDTLAAYLNFSIEDKIQILGEPEINKRLLKIAELLNEAQTVSEIDKKLDETVRSRAEKSQKEYILREKMKAIRDELGEGDNEESDIDAIKKKVAENPYPQNVKDKVTKELKRFQMMPEASLESSLILNYVNTLLNAPWYEKTEDNDDLDNVQKILDEDHFGLDKVKKRIIEYLAVKHATGNLKAPILCFYGPPGCGKTSLAKSIARALGRKFFKASLGGVSDESEIRGHRRTYVGSMPGRIIHGMTKAGVINPVFLLDEIDKVGGSSLHGDPSSALLEVLDPEQNFAFNDNFIEEPYDLSNGLFIATANYLENVPAPLRDRLELIEVPSYTELEKIKIAAHWLVKKQMEMNGLKEGDIEFTEEGIKELIECYTREAGVRQLERLVASCCRKAVVELIKDPKHPRPIVIDSEQAQKYLGVEIFEDTKKEKEPQIGVVTGLAYTEFGGDILPIEVNYMSGKG
ncbi:MAG: endopeptidase La [Bacilli bacterium]|nr:endopeptidase La [Bacilli bacterium]